MLIAWEVVLASSIMSPSASGYPAPVGLASTWLMTTAPGRGIVTGSANPGVPPGVPPACQPELESKREESSVSLRGSSAKPPPAVCGNQELW